MKKILLLFFFTIFLTACAGFSNVTPLPKNSRVAIVTDLDDGIEYYSNTNPLTMYHHEFQNTALNINAALLNPVKSAFIRRGMQVVAIKYRPDAADLTHDKDYLTDLTNKEQVQRIVFIVRDTALFPSMPFHGYGYIERSLFGSLRTLTFNASIRFVVINTDDMVLRDITSSGLYGEKATPTLIEGEATTISRTAGIALQNWLAEKFTPVLIKDMQDTGVF